MIGLLGSPTVLACNFDFSEFVHRIFRGLVETSCEHQQLPQLTSTTNRKILRRNSEKSKLQANTASEFLIWPTVFAFLCKWWILSRFSCVLDQTLHASSQGARASVHITLIVFITVIANSLSMLLKCSLWRDPHYLKIPPPSITSDARIVLDCTSEMWLKVQHIWHSWIYHIRP